MNQLFDLTANLFFKIKNSKLNDSKGSIEYELACVNINPNEFNREKLNDEIDEFARYFAKKHNISLDDIELIAEEEYKEYILNCKNNEENDNG